MRRLLNLAHHGLHRLAATGPARPAHRAQHAPDGHAPDGHGPDRPGHGRRGPGTGRPDGDDGGMSVTGEQYDRFAGRMLAGLHRRAASEAADLPDGAAVLDIGTGPGRLLLHLAARRPGLHAHGVDVSPAMVERARHNAAAHGLAAHITVHLGEAARLPFDDDTLDLVVSTLSVHHWPDVPAAAREIARVLRPGGRLVVYDFRGVADTRPTGALAACPAFAGARVERRTLSGGPTLPLPLFARLALELPRR
ncbi:class I SAM-dependent methyltransferase [Kitasatospora sp. NPDC056327]|uniref:class I SAM-dependent methyltransferase n=1 Tax=Kitasatospora sp. NPDC056327 TaxID=3345785 RepID=UPI0035DE5831